MHERDQRQLQLLPGLNISSGKSLFGDRHIALVSAGGNAPGIVFDLRPSPASRKRTDEDGSIRSIPQHKMVFIFTMA